MIIQVWVPVFLDVAWPNNADGHWVNQTYSPKWWWFLWWFTMAQPIKNNKSKLFIFHGAMCNSRPPELYLEFSGGNGTEPIDEIWSVHIFFAVNFEGCTRKITITASFEGKHIWKISLNTTWEKKTIHPKGKTPSDLRFLDYKPIPAQMRGSTPPIFHTFQQISWSQPNLFHSPGWSSKLVCW